ncbi:dihydrofolate reductase family protein [Nocardioides sambongensis]|uniref:dihydrofolate reductase family protein n=1 Tax=Nocardioides sambongensis TaxID=2589074 RepID=UPI001125F0D7|nr:dihydrofolate reductase family protein [Nocardioides sambongensis]
MTRLLTYSMGVSVDGYVVGPDGQFAWTDPDPEVFALATDEVRGLHTHLLGRRLYQDMLFWEGREQDPELDAAGREFATIWNALPKVVFSSTLPSVRGNARLATGTLSEEVERLRAEPGEGDLAIGGATLAAAAAAEDLIDEYRIRLCPLLVGGGLRYFDHAERRVDLELVQTRRFASQIHYLRYRVRR